MSGRRPVRGGGSKKKNDPTPSEKIDTADTSPLIAKAARPKAAHDDDRPTEIHEVTSTPDVMSSREQLITGLTIGEMVKNRKHALSQALGKLVEKARRDLPRATIDERSSLLLRHEFEFDRRVGYRLKLKLFDRENRCVEVTADVDQDGKAIRRGSMISKLFTI